MSTLLLPIATHAQAYGSGLYGSDIYGGGQSVSVGPITLPITGADLLTIMFAACISIAVGLLVWLRVRQSKAQLVKS